MAPHSLTKHDDISSNSTTRSRRKSSDIPVMQMSDQTDTERRALRLSQRELAKSISNMEGIEDVHSGKFDEVRGENNALWNEVRYTREQDRSSSRKIIGQRIVRNQLVVHPRKTTQKRRNLKNYIRNLRIRQMKINSQPWNCR